MDKTLKYRELLKILKRYGVQEDKARQEFGTNPEPNRGGAQAQHSDQVS